MTYLIAAAGTGGHVFPGLSVGEALVDRGVDAADILYVGGDRLESKVYPELGFPFLQLDVRGLRRSASLANLGIPAMVVRARNRVAAAMVDRGVRAALGMGGYVTIPVGLASRKQRIPFFASEQNAEAGLATRVASRWTRRMFTSFPETGGLNSGDWVGNPVRRAFWDFDRDRIRPFALERYGLSSGISTLGVFGGSLGARVLNDATARLAQGWEGIPLQILHITGERFIDAMSESRHSGPVTWMRVGFEPNMEFFYAASDLVLARAGGAVAELTATATPSILVPGAFGSGGHQAGNARVLADAGAAVTIGEDTIGDLPEVLKRTLLDSQVLTEMGDSARRLARPEAAHTIADAMIEAAA